MRLFLRVGLIFNIFLSFTFFDFAFSLVHSHFLALVAFFLWSSFDLASFFMQSCACSPPLNAELLLVNRTPRADPSLTKPTTSHCLGTFYPILLLEPFSDRPRFVMCPLTGHKAKYGPAVPQYVPD